MIQQGDFALLRPWWLLAIPAVLALAFATSRRRGAVGAWASAIEPHLMAALGSLGRVVPGRPARLWPQILTGAFIAVALVGPARQVEDAPTYRNLDGLVIVMDLSRSIAEGGRLPQAAVAARLVAERGGSRPVALVVYAGDAYLASTFTTDANALGTTIAVLDGSMVPDPGSRPERGLALARQVLVDAQIIASDVVLISDGGGISEAAISEVELIRSAGGRVSTIHVEPTIVPAGMPRAEGAALDAVAAAGGGVAGDALDPLPVAEEAGGGSASRLAASDLTMLLWTDFGRYLLVLALLPALTLFRRRVA